MVKTKILCVVGESGTGKTLIADYIEKLHEVPIVNSRTDRPKRTDDEIGHTFVSIKEFDTYAEEDMIAYTKFGDFRYCCLKGDLKESNVYVIDEDGVNFLRKKFKDEYDIKTLRITCDEEIRKERGVDLERILRNKYEFKMDISEFDYSINNNGGLFDFYKNAEIIMHDWKDE